MFLEIPTPIEHHMVTFEEDPEDFQMDFLTFIIRLLKPVVNKGLGIKLIIKILGKH